MDADRLFIRTLADVERRIEETDEYEVLLIAGLLRKLLLDEHPLMDHVNAQHRMKIRFCMNGVSRYEQVVLAAGPVFWTLMEGIDPERESGVNRPIQEATRDQFLARRVMFVHGHDIRVRDLIDQLAHIEGAVHSGQARDLRQALITQVNREVYFGDLPMGVQQIKSIARVVIRGLAPLRDAVLQTSSYSNHLPAVPYGPSEGRCTTTRLPYPHCSSTPSHFAASISQASWPKNGETFSSVRVIPFTFITR